MLLKTPSFYVGTPKSRSIAVNTLDALKVVTEEDGFNPKAIEKKTRRKPKVREGQELSHQCKRVYVSNQVFILPRIQNRDKVLKGIMSRGQTIYMKDCQGVDLKFNYDPLKTYFHPITKQMTGVFETQMNSHVYVCGNVEEEKNRLIGAKVARSTVLTEGYEQLQEHVDLVCESFGLKPDVYRGKARKPVFARYICHGTRAERNFSDTGSYVYNRNVSYEKKQQMEENIMSLVGILEKKAALIMKGSPILKEQKMMEHLFALPTIREEGYCTQFCIGQNYWAPMHVDDDVYYTTLSCFAPRKEEAKANDEPLENRTPRPDPVLYHFCFPEYDVAFPMKNGDVLLFDPRIPHCSSNPREPNAIIVSAYVSKKVVLRHVHGQVMETAGI